jgi:hypothetical protein
VEGDRRSTEAVGEPLNCNSGRETNGGEFCCTYWDVDGGWYAIADSSREIFESSRLQPMVNCYDVEMREAVGIEW